MDFFFGIFDNDPNDNLPNLVNEHKSLESCVSGHIVNNNFSAYLPYNIGSIDILEERLNQYQDVITYFHFSGHQSKGLIKLNQNHTNIERLIERLNKLPRLKFVFFNGCCTAIHLKEKLSNVPFVIGTNEAIHDKVASRYSKFLYERLFSKIENLNDFEEINQAIEHGIERTFESLNGGGDDDDLELLKTRGGGSLEKFANSIFQIVNSSKSTFESKSVLSYNKDSYPVNDILKSHLNQLDVNDKFYKDYPNFIARILKEFVKDQTPQKKIGVARFLQTKKLIQSFTVFCKCCIASIIWTRKLKDERALLLKLLTDSDLQSFEKESIETLREISHSLIDKYELSSDEKIIINLVLESKNFFQSIKEIAGKVPNDNSNDFPLFLLADKVLHNFILETRALINFQLHSIADIYFHNFIFSDKKNVEFGIKKYTKLAALEQATDILPTITSLEELTNQAYSVHLVKERETLKVLNLKPFIIDWLSLSDEDEKSIQFCYITNLEELNEARTLRYKDFEDINVIDKSDKTLGPRINELNSKKKILKEHYDSFIKFLNSSEND